MHILNIRLRALSEERYLLGQHHDCLSYILISSLALLDLKHFKKIIKKCKGHESQFLRRKKIGL